MNKQKIQEIALASGFKLKEQPDGSMALNQYVFDFARALLSAAPTPPAQDDEWQQAVLNECMAIEGCYKESDPVGTMRCLIDWHVANERAALEGK